MGDEADEYGMMGPGIPTGSPEDLPRDYGLGDWRKRFLMWRRKRKKQEACRRLIRQHYKNRGQYMRRCKAKGFSQSDCEKRFVQRIKMIRHVMKTDPGRCEGRRRR